MWKLTAVLGLAMLVAQQQRTGDATGFRLNPGRAGQLQIGESLDEVYNAVGKQNTKLVDTLAEGMSNPAIEISLAGAPATPSIVAPIREWPCGEFSLWGISVLDPRIRTAEGLGVGSTVADLRKAYSITSSHEEGEHVLVRALQMTFNTSGDSSNDRSSVSSVWLWPDPTGVRARRCPTSEVRQLRPAIPFAMPEKYRGVKDAHDWLNPYVVVRVAGLDLISRYLPGGRKSVPIEQLRDELIALPVAAWPYGRVVAVQEQSIRSVGGRDDEPIRRNRLIVAELLDSLGIRIELWP